MTKIIFTEVIFIVGTAWASSKLEKLHIFDHLDKNIFFSITPVSTGDIHLPNFKLEQFSEFLSIDSHSAVTNTALTG